MRRHIHHRGFLSLLLALALVVAACGTEGGSTTTEGPGQVTTTGAPGTTAPSTTEAPSTGTDLMIVATGDEFACFDPATCSSALPTTTVNYHIFSSLVGHVGNPMELVPNLATSWEYTDPETVTFQLNPDAVFSNGDPVTASDVVYSFGLYALEESPRASYVAAITNVTADDDHTVTFTTAGPRTDLMGNLARLFILPEAAREAVGAEEFGQNPVGSGPYLFRGFESGQIDLERTPDWWGGQVEPAAIRLITTTDPATRAAMLQNNEADVIDAVPIQAIPTLDTGDTEVISLKGVRTIIYAFNTTKPPFDDVRVRQALNHAIDREAILESVLEGHAELLHGPWGAGWIGFDPDLAPYPYDPDRARELLAEAGYPDGFATSFQITDGNRMKDAELAQVIQAQMAEIGVDLELIPAPSSTTNDDFKAGNFDGLTSVTWSVPGDPGGMIIYAFGNQNALAPDEQLADLVSQTQTLVDPDERADALFELGHYVNEQALWLFVHAEDTKYARRAGLGWEPLPVGSGGATLWYWTP